MLAPLWALLNMTERFLDFYENRTAIAENGSAIAELITF